MATNITDFSYRCQPELPGCPLTLINQKVVDAIIQFAEDTHIFEYGFEYAVLSTDVDTSDNNSVTLDLSTITGNPYQNKRPISIPLFKIDGAPFDVEFFELSTDVTNYENIRYGSMRYFSYPSNTQIKMWPFEEQAATLYLTVVFKPVIGITTIDDVIFQDHLKAIEAHVKYVLFDQPDKKWSNPKQSMVEWGKYAEKMGFAKINIVQGRTKRSTMIQSKYIF